jgi:hypothetical protein
MVSSVDDLISPEEIKDFLLYKKLSKELNLKLNKLMSQDKNLSKLEALELLLDYYENQYN